MKKPVQIPNPILEGLPCTQQRGKILADACMRVPGWGGVWALGDPGLVDVAQHLPEQTAAPGEKVAGGPGLDAGLGFQQGSGPVLDPTAASRPALSPGHGP